MSRIGRIGRTELPEEQQTALRKAVRWEWFTIAYTSVTIAVIALVAGVALLGVGLNLARESFVGLVTAEHPTIGTVVLFGQTVWLGWLMVVVMAVVIVGPVFLYGPAKSKLAPVLHNKLLYADADMAKADWQTTVASIVGVLGVGVGLWWLDGAAALFISLGIIWDGVKNTRTAVIDLMDQRARTYDSSAPHPLAGDILSTMRSRPWVKEASVRMRDQGQVFHVEAFVVPHRGRVSLEDITDLEERITDLDWKVQEIVIVPTESLPEGTDRSGRGCSRPRDRMPGRMPDAVPIARAMPIRCRTRATPTARGRGNPSGGRRGPTAWERPAVCVSSRRSLRLVTRSPSGEAGQARSFRSILSSSSSWPRRWSAWP